MNKFIGAILLLAVVGEGGIPYTQKRVVAQKMSLNVTGGYATVSLEDANESLQELQRMIRRMLGHKTSLTEFGRGLVLEVDVGYEVSPGFSIGPKISYLRCSQAKFSAEGWTVYEYGGAEFYVYEKRRLTIDTSLIPIMFGGYFSRQVADKISLSGGLHFGLGLANAQEGFKYEGTEELTGESFTESYRVPYSGSGLVVDLSTRGSYQIAPNISFGLNLGYRFATISEMKATKDVVDADVEKGDVLEDIHGNAIKFNYGGLTVGGFLSCKF